MMQNKLNSFRAEIDKIDGDIIKSLKQRMQVISRVADFKKENGEKFFIKSAREADMIKDLIVQFPEFSKSAITKIWRAIITSANLHEQAIQALIYNPKKIPDYKYLVREYYLDILPIFEFENFDNLILEISKNPAQIAVFPAENFTENWWINLANNKALKIFAKIENNYGGELFLAAIKESEKSSSDNSLLLVEINKNFSENDLINSFKNCQISAKILNVFAPQDGENNFYLIDSESFVDESGQELTNFYREKISPIVKVIGYYPK